MISTLCWLQDHLKDKHMHVQPDYSLIPRHGYQPDIVLPMGNTRVLFVVLQVAYMHTSSLPQCLSLQQNLSEQVRVCLVYRYVVVCLKGCHVAIP